MEHKKQFLHPVGCNVQMDPVLKMFGPVSIGVPPGSLGSGERLRITMTPAWIMLNKAAGERLWDKHL